MTLNLYKFVCYHSMSTLYTCICRSPKVLKYFRCLLAHYLGSWGCSWSVPVWDGGAKVSCVATTAPAVKAGCASYCHYFEIINILMTFYYSFTSPYIHH